jgi:hypothetical protein
MNLDPLLFASPMYETANEAVLFCKDFLQEKGFTALAERLAGNTPVNAIRPAIVVRDILLEARAQVRGEAAEYVSIALGTVERALQGSASIAALLHASRAA